MLPNLCIKYKLMILFIYLLTNNNFPVQTNNYCGNSRRTNYLLKTIGAIPKITRKYFNRRFTLS